jgi:PKD repeat protein
MKSFLPIKRLVLVLAIPAGLSSCSKSPEACFVADKGSLNTKVNEEIQFSAACSTDADTYSWEYGDGSGDNGATVKHKYSKTGAYTVKLTAKNSSKSSSTSQTVTIAP